MRAAHGFGPESRTLRTLSVAFDGAALESWPVLLAGGALDLLRGTAADVDRLVGDLCRACATHVFLVPVLLGSAATTADPSSAHQPPHP